MKWSVTDHKKDYVLSNWLLSLTVCDIKPAMKKKIKLSFIYLIFVTLIKNTNDLLLAVNMLLC